MTTKINTYEDLLQEKKRLQALLLVQKQVIRQDIEEIKEEFKPVRSAISAVSKVTTRDSGNWLMNFVGNKAIDLLVKKLILRKAGWLTRLAVPFFLKNVSSYIIAEHKDEILSKIFSWVGNKNENGQEKYADYED